MSILIGFGHKAQQGKDLVAQFIIDAFGDKYDIRRYSFADALKEEVAGHEEEIASTYGIPLTQDSTGKFRNVLQFWGEHKRSENPDYWIMRLASKVDLENPKVALIPDLRYKNEFEFIRDRKGYCVKVERFKDGHILLASDMDHSHLSETSLDYETEWWATIRCTDGDIKDLRSSAIELFNMIRDDLDVIGQYIRYLKENGRDTTEIEAQL